MPGPKVEFLVKKGEEIFAYFSRTLPSKNASSKVSNNYCRYVSG